MLLACVALGGCAYRADDTFDAHFQRYKVRQPEADRVFVCSSYGCRTQTGFRFTEADISQIKGLMSSAHTASAEDERRAVGVTLAWMERRVGDATGTSADRPADDLEGNGDPTQMDCVDVATNLTSYLLVAATLSIPGYILGEAALSFLGLGIQEPSASWGLMLSHAQNDMKVFMLDFWWLLTPGVAIFVTVIAFNVLGDVLRDIVDPRMKV